MALFIGKCLFDGYFIFGVLAVVGRWWGGTGRSGGEGRYGSVERYGAEKSRFW